HSYPLQLLRGLCLFGASMLVINGFARLPLTETSAILFLAPMIVTLLSGLLLKEKAGPMEWLAVGCGFVGVLIIARPGGGLLPWAQLALVAGAGAIGALGHMVITKALSYAPAASLTPYSYFQLVFVAFLGWQVFGAVPDLLSWLGILVIVAGGLMISVRRLL